MLWVQMPRSLKILSDDEGLLTHCLRVVDLKFDLRWNSEKNFFFESECKKLVLLFLDLNSCVLRRNSTVQLWIELEFLCIVLRKY